MRPVDSMIEVAAPRVGVAIGWRSWLMIVASSTLGLFSIAWPLLIPVSEQASNSTAPLAFAVILPVVLLLAISQLSEGGLDSKALAMLGVLSALNAAIRPVLGAGTAGVESVFFLLILAGRAFGPGFAYLLGFTSLLASALLTAQVGPWLPFQMMCAAWVGLGAGLLPKRVRGRWEVAMLIAYGVVSAYLFGMVMNLWFWPFMTGTDVQGSQGTLGALDYVAGAPLLQNLRHFILYTLVSSTGGWDTGRAITTAVAIGVLGRPVLGVLHRAAGMARVA